MPASGKHGEVTTLEVACVDGAFFGAVVDGDDAPERGGFLELGEEVDDEANAGVEGDGGEVVEIFFGVCGKR